MRHRSVTRPSQADLAVVGLEVAVLVRPQWAGVALAADDEKNPPVGGFDGGLFPFLER